MKTYSIVAVAAVTLVLIAGPVQGQKLEVEKLQEKLEQRDMVIKELLERVEALERRVGVAEGPSAETGEPSKPKTAAPAGEDAAKEDEPAPGMVVVEEGAAERALERSLTQTGALLLSPGILELEPSIRYARQEDRTPSLVSSGNQSIVAQTERNADSVAGDLALRLGLPWDSQLEVGLPYRWRSVDTVRNVGFSPISESTQTGAGFGDVRIGLAKTLFREGLWRPDFVGRITWDTATGERSDDGVSLGGDFNEIQGSLTAIKRQDPIAFIGSLSYGYAFKSEQVQPGAIIQTSFGGFIALNPETSLRLVFSGAHRGETEVSGSDIDGSSQTLGTFTIGASTLLAPGTLLNLTTGIGLTDNSDDFSIRLSLPIRFDSSIF